MDLIRQSLQNISIEGLRGHIQALEGIRHPVVAPEALERAADYIYEALQSLDYELSEHRFHDGGGEFRNILATRLGSRYPNKRAIVLAHYDTVADSPGANDNASGVAGVLELARVLKSLQFERTVQFTCVSLEERSSNKESICRGSQALAAYAKTNAWEIEGVINLEEIAFAGDDILQTAPNGLPFEFPEVGDFIAVVGNQASAELVQGFAQSIHQYDIPLPHFPLLVPGNGEALPDSRRSDHASFWDCGYPAIMVTDTANFRTPHYHQPSDTLETLNLVFAAAVCRAAGGLLADLTGYSAKG